METLMPIGAPGAALQLHAYDQYQPLDDRRTGVAGGPSAFGSRRSSFSQPAKSGYGDVSYWQTAVSTAAGTVQSALKTAESYVPGYSALSSANAKQNAQLAAAQGASIQTTWAGSGNYWYSLLNNGNIIAQVANTAKTVIKGTSAWNAIMAERAQLTNGTVAQTQQATSQTFPVTASNPLNWAAGPQAAAVSDVSAPVSTVFSKVQPFLFPLGVATLAFVVIGGLIKSQKAQASKAA